MNDKSPLTQAHDLRNAIHVVPVAEVFPLLGSSPTGLTKDEVVDRRRRYGVNRLHPIREKSLFVRFLAAITHLMAILLWCGGGIAFVAGLSQLGWAIWAVVLVNGAFSFWQEYRAGKAMEALRGMLPPTARVVRDGREQRVPAVELVPGDQITVMEGERISADCRLVVEAELRVDQSALSGESHPLRKTAEALTTPDSFGDDCANLIYAGTTVTSGTGRAVVYATGMTTRFGTIADLTMGLPEELSPLQKEINRMTTVVSVLAVSIGIVFFLLSVLVLHRPVSAGFMFSLGMVVAFVPEGLLPTVTLALAMGVQRMARRNALIKKLSSVETLGCCSVICTDKTGTLTQNEMTVRSLWVSGRSIMVSGTGYDPTGQLLEDGRVLATISPASDLDLLLRAMVLCNDARLVPPEADGDPWRVLGDPTEAALLVAAGKGGMDFGQLARELPRRRELPFDSRRKRMSTIHSLEVQGSSLETVTGTNGAVGFLVFVKGAPKEILDLCETARRAGTTRILTDAERLEIVRVTDSHAAAGMRVLAMAMRFLPTDHDRFTSDAVERQLIFLGLAAMLDPPRDEVAAAVATCRRAGIRIIMITGDYGLTAESIARRIGIVGVERPLLLSGRDLDGMDDSSLEQALQGEVLFARVAPEHKLRVVGTLQGMGHVVAVTGDGVNDAPALKKADIGVAMGNTGTDVARETADMVLDDDNFSSIVHAIEEGRAVYANIRKFVTYIFSSNMPEAWPFILQLLFGMPLALNVMQILAIDLGTDMVPALALGAERPEPGIMDRPPRSRRERLIDGPLLVRSLLWLGTLQTVLCFTAFFALYALFGYHDPFNLPRVDLLPFAERLTSREGYVYALASTLFFTAVIATQIGNAYACRTDRTSVFSVGLFSNRFLLAGILVELVLAVLLIHVRCLRQLFGFVPLPTGIWLPLLIVPPLLLAAEELRKAGVRWLMRRRDAPGGVP